MAINIYDLVSSKEFARHLKQIAGFDGLSREIMHISVIDTPLVPLPPYALDDNVFVLSSFYLYRDDPEQMLEAVKNLDIIGASALAVKTDMYITFIPESIIKYCNDHAFPLFVTTDNIVPFRKLISIVEDRIKAADSSDSKVLFEGFLSGRSKSTLYKLANDSFPYSFICLSVDRKVIVKNANSDFSDLSALESAAASQLEHINSSKPGSVMPENYHFIPCYVRDNLEAIFVFFCSQTPLPFEIKRTAKMLTILISLQIMENILQDAGQRQLASNIASSLLLSDYPNEEAARQKFRSQGFPNVPYFRLLLCSDIPELSNEPFFLSRSTHSVIENAIQSYFVNSLCLNIGSTLISVIPIHEKSKYRSDSNFINAAQSVVDRLASTVKLRVIISPLQRNLSMCSRLYRHMKLYDEMNTERTDGVLLVKDFDELSILMAITDTSQHEALDRLIITPLLEYDRQYNYALMDTLDVCLRLQSLEKASASLHIHSSTLRYRLQKIQELTGYNFFDFHDRTVLSMSCLLWNRRKISESI